MSTEEKAHAILEKHFPEFVYSDMDGAFFWKSLEEYQPGDLITHEGTTYRVEYSWAWWKPFGVQVFMCEMVPASVPSRRGHGDA